MASLVTRLGWALLSALVLEALVARPSPVAAAKPPTTDASAEVRLLAEVNGDRAAVGLGPLAVDPRLAQIARVRARYLVERRAFSHCADLAAICPPSEYDFALLLRRAGVPFALAGENLGEDAAPAAQVADSLHADWARSPAHYQQMVNPAFNATGFGVACCTTITDDRGASIGNVSIAVEIFAQEPPATYGKPRARG